MQFIENQASSIEYLASSIEHPVSSIGHLFLLIILILPLPAAALDTLHSALVERYISPGQLHYCCIPVASTPARVFALFTVKYYKENQHLWKTVSGNSDSILNIAMEGYSIWSTSSNTDSNIIYYKGKMNTGAFNIVLTRTWNPAANPPAYDGWNVAGNLYPSASDFESTGWTLNNVDPTIYFFDGVNYKPYNRVDHLGNGSSIIPSMQGFFVHVTSGNLGIMSVDNSTRMHSLQPYYKDIESNNELLSLETEGNGYSDETFIQLDSSATSNFDWRNDAYKLFGITQSPQLYSVITGIFASINVLPYSGPNTIVPLGFRVGVAGSYSIIAHGINSFTYVTSIFLKDAKENYWQNLMADSIYSFTSNPADDPNRFFIYFNYIPAGIPGNNENSGISIYSNADFVYIKNLGHGNIGGDICIYDLIGRPVFRDRLQNLPLNRFRVGVQTGYYLVRVITEENTCIRKIFLK